jgi:hypothetical protein
MRCRRKSNSKSHIFEHRLDWELKLEGYSKVYKFIKKIIWQRFLLDLEMEAPGTFPFYMKFVRKFAIDYF